MQLIPYNQTDYKSGAILMEAALAKAGVEKVYEWQSKIKFAFGPSDIIAFLDMLATGTPSELRLYHPATGQTGQKGAKGKVLQMRPGTDAYEGTWMFSFNDDTSGTPLSVSVPVSRGEFQIFVKLLEDALPAIFGWGTSVPVVVNTKEG